MFEERVRTLAEELLAQIDESSTRFVLGITGPPGAGKSFLAGALEETINEARHEGFVAVAPVDGFHLSNATLDALGLRAVKGAPQTFDAKGFVHLLRRVRREPQATIRWPAFDRHLDAPVPAAIAIPPATRIVITEGNYLLLDRPWWRQVRPLLDDVWYVDAAPEVIRKRLIARQLAGGRTEEEAIRHVDGSDLPNAAVVALTRTQAAGKVRLV